MNFRRIACAACFLFLASFATAQSLPTSVAYTVSLVSPEAHLVEVQLTLPPGAAERELQLRSEERV